MLYLLFFDCSQHFSDTIKVSPDIPAYHNERGPIYERYVSTGFMCIVKNDVGGNAC